MALLTLSAFDKGVHELTQEGLPRVQHSDALALKVMDTARHTRNMLIMDDRTQVQKEIAGVHKNAARQQELLAEAVAGAVTPEEKEALSPVLEAVKQDAPEEAEFIRLVEAGSTNDAKALLSARLRPAQLHLTEEVEKFATFQSAAMSARTDALAKSYRERRSFLLLLAGLALASSAAFALLIARSVTAPLRRIISHFDAIGHGNLKEEIVADSTDEIGQVLQALRTTQTALRDAAVAAADYQGQITAIRRAQAVVEFGLDGGVIGANENAQRMTGYTPARATGETPQSVCGQSAIERGIVSPPLGETRPWRVRCRSLQVEHAGRRGALAARQLQPDSGPGRQGLQGRVLRQ